MTSYIRSLDGLRALAVTLVMLFHFQLLDSGWMGVQIFFVLSGFLITRILLNERAQELGFYLKRFYWRRSLRIFPLYFTYLLLITGVFMFVQMPESALGKLPYLYTYTFNFTRLSPEWTHSPLFTHFWSLSVEEQFYLAWPLLIFLVPLRALKWTLLGIIASGPVIRYLLGRWLIGSELDDQTAGEAIYWFTLSHFDAFAMGGAIALFRLPERISYPGRWFAGIGVLTLLAGLINWWLLYRQGQAAPLHSFGFSVGDIRNYQHIWGYSLLNACFSFFIIALITTNRFSASPLARLFQHPFMVSVGRVSYGMYVFHWAVMAVYAKILSPYTGMGWFAFGLYFFLVWGISWLSFTQYESRFLYFKNRFFTSPQKAKITATAMR
jgi:peptidoglycan/LPS O-acetylase OafA/YrhL